MNRMTFTLIHVDGLVCLKWEYDIPSSKKSLNEVYLMGGLYIFKANII